MSCLGFIGIGTIGGPMAARLVSGGHALVVHDVSVDATARLVAEGARAADSVGALAQACDTVFLSLPGPPQVAAVMDQLLAAPGAVRTVVDLSTNALALNRELAARAAAQGIAYLDAPVSGGKVAAKDGTLAVMVGGDEAAFAAVKPLIECFARHIFHLGASGAGTLAKLVNNQIFLCASVLIQEGFVMGAKAGMDPSTLLEVLKVSSAGSLVARAPLLLARRFEQDIFALSIAAKDVTLALESGAAVGASMPATAAALGVYQEALAHGLGHEDFYATVKVLEQQAGITLPPLARPKA